MQLCCCKPAVQFNSGTNTAGKYCWNRDYRRIISSIKDRYEWIVILVATRTDLFVVYREQVVEESHLVRFVGLYETERVTSETLRGERF